VQLFFSGTFVLGVMALAGLALMLEPAAAVAVLALPLMVWRAIGAALLFGVVIYLALSATGRVSGLRFGTHRIDLPPAGLTALQVLLATLDLAAAAAALYVLLPDLGVSFPAFVGLFTAAIIVGVLSHVPGALGVFESLLLLMLQPAPEQLPAVVGGLVMFRAIYYVLPLLLGALTLGALEWRRSAGPIQRALGVGLRTASPLAPRLFATLTFLGGAVLLASGALPAEQARLDLVSRLLPDSLVEVSHLAGSLIGMALLLLSRSLDHRVREAWLATVWLLTAGIAASLLKGFDYEEAIFLLILLGGLVASWREFYRTSSLLEARLTLRWALTVAMTLAAVTWLIVFAYRHVDYSHDLWWQFELQADAPRSLRATLGAAILLGVVGLLLLLRPAVRKPALPDSDALARAQAIVAQGGAEGDWLALTGDKTLLFNDAGDGFIMYAAIGRTWVAMGEPVGPKRAWPELIWRFHEEANRHGARTVFYEVPGRSCLSIWTWASAR
jgi:phosphatidylglycerol lysyltransferase